MMAAVWRRLPGRFSRAMLPAILCLAVSAPAQWEHQRDEIMGLKFGLNKTLEMDAEDVGAGKHLGGYYYYKFFPYLAVGGEVLYTHVEGIIIKSHAPEISLGLLQLRGTARFKTADNERNVYGFLDLSPGFTADVTPNDPEKSGVDYKSYWGPLFTASLGTVMGTGMIKLSLDNYLLDNELITLFTLSLGLGI